VALTNAQRQTAFQAIFASQDVQALSPVPAGTPLASILPGVTAAQVLSGLVTAIGTAYDTELQIVINALLTIVNAQLTAAQASVTTLQAQVAAL
jgi:hypothetical protein